MVYRSLLYVILIPFTAAAQSIVSEIVSGIVSGASKSEFELPKLEWSGDIRVRAQTEKKGDDEARKTQRIRVRFGVSAMVQKDLRAEIRVATAKGSRSSNQSLGDNSEPGSRRRFVGLDLAYARWTPVPFASLSVGRFPQIHFVPGGSELILDDDLALEGAGLSVGYEFLQNYYVFGSMGSAFIRENYDNYYSEDLSDNMINFGQLGVKWKRDKIQAAMGFGFFNFTSVQGKNYTDLAVGGKANGNSEGAPGVVAYPYLPKQYFTEFKFHLGSLDTKLFYEWVENNEAPRDNNGKWIGFEVGQKSWDFNLAYTVLETDAVMAMFSSSDFGDGVTDVHGWTGKVRWKVARNMSLRLMQMVARTDMTGLNREYRRTHVDVSASF